MTYNDFETSTPLPLSELKKAWDALSDDERNDYREDYAFQVASSHHDAGDHPFHAILSK